MIEVLANDLTATAIERNQLEQQAEAQRQQAAQSAALGTQRKAGLDLATAQFKLSMQVINAVWKAIDPNIRKQLLPIQRAWISKTKADCQIEAASASTEHDEIEAARLNCETERNASRTAELRQYPTNSNTAAAEAAASDAAAAAAHDFNN